MNFSDYSIMCYDRVIRFLPCEIRNMARKLTADMRRDTEEIRLRTGQCPTVLLAGKEMQISSEKVGRRDIDSVLEIATKASSYAVRQAVCAGYITIDGGHRIGICGEAVYESGKMLGFREISSLNIRIARERKGISDKIMGKVCDGDFRSTLLISPPGAGKTTLLRDLVRNLSNGFGEDPGYRISLVDERCEIASVCGGMPQMDVGRKTDVITSCTKADAVLMMLRAMNPEIIAVDEITDPEDAKAIEKAANCGVKIIASAHGNSLEEIRKRPLYKSILDMRIFENLIIIRRSGTLRTYEVVRLEADT